MSQLVYHMLNFPVTKDWHSVTVITFSLAYSDQNTEKSSNLETHVFDYWDWRCPLWKSQDGIIYFGNINDVQLGAIQIIREI